MILIEDDAHICGDLKGESTEKEVGLGGESHILLSTSSFSNVKIL
jgi:hypothetical protein